LYHHHTTLFVKIKAYNIIGPNHFTKNYEESNIFKEYRAYKKKKHFKLLYNYIPKIFVLLNYTENVIGIANKTANQENVIIYNSYT